jgi:hypothetical protein
MVCECPIKSLNYSDVTWIYVCKAGRMSARMRKTKSEPFSCTMRWRLSEICLLKTIILCNMTSSTFSFMTFPRPLWRRTDWKVGERERLEGGKARENLFCRLLRSCRKKYRIACTCWVVIENHDDASRKKSSSSTLINNRTGGEMLGHKHSSRVEWMRRGTRCNRSR